MREKILKWIKMWPFLNTKKRMKDIILIGRQGSGKGTQGKILAKKYGYKIFETGGALRAMAEEESDLGQKVKEITSCGDLVPNEIVMEIVADFLSNLDASTPVIFDGIPRSIEQQETLSEELEKAGREFLALEIELSTDVAVARLLERGKIEGRADDNIVAIQKRIENFEQFTVPVIEGYKSDGKLIAVNGDQDLDQVTKEVCKALDLA